MPAKYIETTSVPVSALTPLPGNARKGNVEVIRESLKANGQYRSLVVRRTPDGELVILAGNHTHEAAVLEGRKEIRCDIIECTDEEAVRIALIDNKAPDLGEYDDAALLSMLESLDDLEGTGYSMDDLDDLLAGMDRVGETAFEQTLAAYTETEEELTQRSQKLSEIKSQDSQGIRETVLVLPQEQHEELHRLLQEVKRHLEDESLTNGEVVLRCARTLSVIADIYHSHEPGCDCEWCKVTLASESPR
jgi:ParB-like chromosome segregation protein Spo0J